MEELDEKYSDNDDVGFLKVNTQTHVQFAMDNNITGIPCVLIFVDGKPAQIEIASEQQKNPVTIDRLVGLRPAEHYEYVISTVIGEPSD
jgi:thioredoxin-like negative regulator of GroEL